MDQTEKQTTLPADLSNIELWSGHPAIAKCSNSQQPMQSENKVSQGMTSARLWEPINGRDEWFTPGPTSAAWSWYTHRNSPLKMNIWPVAFWLVPALVNRRSINTLSECSGSETRKKLAEVVLPFSMNIWLNSCVAAMMPKIFWSFVDIVLSTYPDGRMIQWTHHAHRSNIHRSGMKPNNLT